MTVSGQLWLECVSQSPCNLFPKISSWGSGPDTRWLGCESSVLLSHYHQSGLPVVGLLLKWIGPWLLSGACTPVYGHQAHSTHTCIHKFNHTHTLTHTHTHIYTCICSNTHTQAHTDTHTLTHTHMHIHTYTHIFSRPSVIPSQDGLTRRSWLGYRLLNVVFSVSRAESTIVFLHKL